ncbi:LysR substrate-binding domain-containing protein [Kushneria aurantia]|uniref:LysR substrate-binding domain-containing protein n=1 Tax=Kushneria aurantia TaxID=504092 RepID=A0ABV6G216_9GAMM|nr:LysR substrate-binding domain-containing protein [Kushneria aurantia]
MELRHLRYFLAVAEEGHFGRAAERLHIVQSALSMQIRAFEDKLGGPLFIRTSRRVELTDAGKLLRSEAERILAQAAHTQRTVERLLRGETGTVRIGFAGNAVFSGRLMADVRAFHAAFPDADVELRELAPRAQVEEIQAGRLDIGYAPNHAGAMDEGALCYERIGAWSFLLVVPENHPLAATPSLRMSMLNTEALIIYAAHEADDRLLEGVRRALGHEPRVHRMHSTLSVLALVASGMGMALVPEPLAQVRLPGLAYRLLEDLPQQAELLLISRKVESGGAAREFLEIAHQALRD